MVPDTQRSCDVVYFILSHKEPRQVVRLVERLLRDNARARVVIHHDYARSFLDPASLDSTRVDLLRNIQAIGWGSYDQLQAILQSLRWIDDHLEYRWVVFISGQDYPLLPPVEIQRFLLASEFDAFIEQPRLVSYRFRDEAGARDFWSARYFYAYYPLPKLLRRLPPRLAKAFRNLEVLIRSKQPFVFFWMMPEGANTLVGIRRRRHPFGAGFRCYCGSDSFTWSRKAVAAVLEFVERRPEVLAYYRRCIHPSESFFNSILMNTSGLHIHFDNLRYDRFAGPEAGHPEVLRSSDLEALLSSGKQFARKFDLTVDETILDALDRSIDSPAGKRRIPAGAASEAEG
jgi:hypothetical protein